MRFASILLVSALVTLTGCVGVAIGPTARPVDQTFLVDKNGNGRTSINLPDRKVVISVDGYPGDIGFIGPGVPIIPIGPWKVLGFTGRDEYRLTIYIHISPLAKDISFNPRSIKILVNGKEHSPTILLQSEYCRVGKTEVYPGEGPILLPEKICFRATFGDIAPPSPEFTLVADGLQPVRFVVTREVRGGLLGQD